MRTRLRLIGRRPLWACDNVEETALFSRLRHRAGLGALLLTVALAASACGGNDGDGGAASGGGQQLSGSIKISGSSTVEPISSLVAEKFSGANSGVQVSVDGPGTGDGFKLFCNGETDISDASRQINDEEVAACQAKGIEYIELKIGIDGLSVITSVKNEAVKGLNFGDLYALLGPESEGFKTWNAADSLAKEVGGNGGFPAAPLTVTAPGEESGTYDSFVELALGDIAEERKKEPGTRKDYQSSANDNTIVEGVAGNDTSLGWVGFAFADQNKEQLKLIPIAEEGTSFVEPTQQTIADGSYPLARNLYIYVNKAKAETPAVKAFVDYYLNDEGIAAVTEVDYIAIPAEDLQKTRDAWTSKTTGKQQS
jgi:phosphate transport system substrate-binding protein